MAKKILIIEDDPTMQTLLQTYLQFEGFEVAIQNCDEKLQQVIENVIREAPDVILLDVYLRQLNGFDLLAAIRSDIRTNGTAIIMSSGVDFGERCTQEGADAFILKPYMPEELVQSIQRVIAKRGDPERE
jgi:DNA-binding response OmpR family regulator